MLSRRIFVALVIAIALFPTLSAHVLASAEYVLVQKVMDDQAVIVRSNGGTYLIEKGVGCLSLWRFEGKKVIVDSPGLFLGVGSKLVLPDVDQECRIWNSKEIGSGQVAPPPGGALTRPQAPKDDEFSFYDSQGKATAYLELSDGLTFYLWSGEPAAYLDGESVFGFNGKHLGWYHQGLIYDHDGDIVVAPANAFREAPGTPPIRSVKSLKPLKGLKELKPLKPLFGRSWAKLPARVFFFLGVD